jgi:O-antigen ligase
MLLPTFSAGRAIVDLLPFVGTVDAANVEYRQRLMDIAFEAVWESPWFGGIDIYAAEGGRTLDQGGGFVDVVNTYVGILLGSGFIGLSLFLGFFATVCLSLYRVTHRAADHTDERRVLGRALLATMIGVLIIILTVSSISVIPTIYWCVAGIAVAYSRLMSGQTRSPVGKAKTISPAVRNLGRPLGTTLDR